MTEICDRTLKAHGPALLFTNPTGFKIPVLCNLFGTLNRITMALGKKNISSLRNIGKLLVSLKEPEPLKGFKDFFKRISDFKKILNMPIKKVSKAPCQEKIIMHEAVNLYTLPIMTCWPEDIAPLVTFGLTITENPYDNRKNMGVYRQQVINKNQLIMRWLPQRGGARDFQEWCKKYPGINFPVTTILGADPVSILSAVIPLPDYISEYSFAGLLRGNRTKVIKCISNNLYTIANAEIVLEGYIEQNKNIKEGPYGDHTGYYNEVSNFPIFTVTCITQRSKPIYHSTHTGRPLDEPSIISMALNEIFIPILQKQFPEIVDFYLPPEACSYRLAIITINKQFPGHARRIMMGIWSFLKQFMYTKFIIVCDNDINARNWKDVIWAISTRVDPIRDTLLIDKSTIDYLDFSSPISGLGSKMGIDATNKWLGETERQWGRPIIKDKKITSYINKIWEKLKIFN